MWLVPRLASGLAEPISLLAGLNDYNLHRIYSFYSPIRHQNDVDNYTL
ncbi:MAG: hypothetical protein SCH10_01440 [Nitrosomonadaceae bacterium]|nr:hypothetical protein [Nitrosomonadaceae bacterium]